MTSPFAIAGATLVANGYSAVPCAPGTKVPGQYRNKQWRFKYDWPHYCDRLPTHYEVPLWEKWPDAGVGLACGFGGLVAVDLDTDDAEIQAAILRELPEPTVAKRGSKGWTAFFRGDLRA